MRKINTKNCPKCQKDFQDRHANQKYCSPECMNKARHVRNYKPKKRKRYREELAKNYPDKKMYWGVKYRARKNGIDFNIELEDIVIPEFCPVLGLKLEPNIGGNSPSMNSPSLDKIDPSKGYTKGNIMVISHRANSLKNNAQIWELEAVLAYMKSHE